MKHKKSLKSELYSQSNGSFQITGPLVFDTVPPLWAASKKLFPALDRNTITMDVQAVQEVDSSGIALLVAWTRWAHVHNKKLEFTNVSEKIITLAEINKLSGILHLSEE